MKTKKTPANSAPPTFRYNNPKDIDWRIEKGNHRYNEIRDLVFQSSDLKTRREEPFFTPFSVIEFKGATFDQLHEAMNAEIKVKALLTGSITKDFKVSPGEIFRTIRQAEEEIEETQQKENGKTGKDSKPKGGMRTGINAASNDDYKDKLLLKSLLPAPHGSTIKNLSVKANNQEVIMSMMDALKSILENKSLSGGTQISSKDKLQNIRTTLTDSCRNPLYPIINSIYEKHSSIKATSAYKLYCFEQELLLLQRQIDQYVPQYEKYLLSLTGPKVKIAITTTSKTPSTDIDDFKEPIKIFQEGIDRKLETVNKVEKKQINRLFGERTRLFEAEKSPSLEDLESTVFTKEQLEELLSKDLTVEANDSLERCLETILFEDERGKLHEILYSNIVNVSLAYDMMYDFLQKNSKVLSSQQKGGIEALFPKVEQVFEQKSTNPLFEYLQKEQILNTEEILSLRNKIYEQEALVGGLKQKKSLRSNVARTRVFDFLDNLTGDQERKAVIKNFKENNDELSFLLDSKIVSSEQKKLWIQIEEALEDIIQFNPDSSQSKISHAKVRGFLDTGDGKTFLAEEIISGIEAIIKRVGNGVSGVNKEDLVNEAYRSKGRDATNKFAKQAKLAKNFRIVKINLANQEAIETLLKEARKEGGKLPLLGVFVIGDEFPFFKEDPRLRELTAAGAKVTGFSASANIVELMDAVHQAKEKNPEQKQIDKNKRQLQLLRSGGDLEGQGIGFESVEASADNTSPRARNVLGGGSLESVRTVNADPRVARIFELDQENTRLEQAGKYRKVKADAAEGNYNAALFRRDWAREVANKLSDRKSFVQFNLNYDADNGSGSLKDLVTSAHKKANSLDQYRRTQCIFPGLVFEADTIEDRLKNIATTNPRAVITANYIKDSKHYSAIYENESIKNYAADSDLFKERIEAIAKSTARQNVIMIYAGDYAGVVGGDNGVLSNLDPQQDNQVVFLENAQHVDIDLLKQMFSRDRGKGETLPRRVVVNSSLQELFLGDKKLGDVAFDKNQQEALFKRVEHFEKKIRKYFSGMKDDEIDALIKGNFIQGTVYKREILDCEIGIIWQRNTSNQLNIKRSSTDYKGRIHSNPEWIDGDKAAVGSKGFRTTIENDHIQYSQNKFTRDLRLLILYKSMAEGTFNINDYSKIIDSDDYSIPGDIVTELRRIKDNPREVSTLAGCAKNFEALSYLARAEKDIDAKRRDFIKKHQQELIDQKQAELDLAKIKREKDKTSAKYEQIKKLVDDADKSLAEKSSEADKIRAQNEKAVRDAQAISDKNRIDEKSRIQRQLDAEKALNELQGKLEDLKARYNTLQIESLGKVEELKRLKLEQDTVARNLTDLKKTKVCKAEIIQDRVAKDGTSQELIDKLLVLEGEIARFSREKEKAESEIALKKSETYEISKSIEDTKLDIYAIDLEIGEHEALVKKRESDSEAFERINAETRTLINQAEAMSLEKDRMSKELLDEKQKKSQLEIELELLKTKMDSSEETVKQLNDQIEKITRAKVEFKGKNDALQIDLDSLKEEISKERGENSLFANKKEELEGLILKNKERIDDLEKQKNEDEKKLAEAEKRNLDLSKELEVLNESITDLAGALEKMNSDKLEITKQFESLSSQIGEEIRDLQISTIDILSQYLDPATIKRQTENSLEEKKRQVEELQQLLAQEREKLESLDKNEHIKSAIEVLKELQKQINLLGNTSPELTPTKDKRSSASHAEIDESQKKNSEDNHFIPEKTRQKNLDAFTQEKAFRDGVASQNLTTFGKVKPLSLSAPDLAEAHISKIQPKDLSLFAEPQKRGKRDDRYYNAEFNGIKFLETEEGRKLAGGQGIFNDAILFLAKFKKCEFTGVDFSKMDPEILGTIKFTGCTFHSDCKFPKGFRFKDSNIPDTIFRGKAEDIEVARRLGLSPPKETAAHQVIPLVVGAEIKGEKPKSFASAAMEQFRSNKIHPLDSEKSNGGGQRV